VLKTALEVFSEADPGMLYTEEPFIELPMGVGERGEGGTERV
jgi:hypothetical protein